MGQQLVQGSCEIKYSLEEMVTSIHGWYEIGLALVLVIILVFLVILLYRERLYAVGVGEDESWPVGIVGDTISCEEFRGRGERRRREEEMFMLAHSWLGGRKRGRSRSRRRK